MTTPLLIRMAATVVFGLAVADTTGWFPNALPLAGSHAVEAAIVIGTAAVLQEFGEYARELIRKLRAWWWWRRR